ncbi:MAG TPA: SHOCT domain-containing protein [Gaiellales bacterium]|jgi:hypothetical protein|nr:SHOCT domain-containing protein [Gaiellales bacterium]
MSFWDAFFLLLIYIPLILVWGFAVLDIFRRDDVRGVSKAIWLAVVIFIPFFGTLIYLLMRKPGATPEERRVMDTANRDFVESYSPTTTAEQIKMLADLHDRGKLTDEEFHNEKARLLQGSDSADVGSPAVATA